ncbi:ABC transporter substrate-binding protein [Amycolatopsis lurida]
MLRTGNSFRRPARRTRVGVLLSSLVLLASTSGCGLLGGDEGGTAAEGNAQVEKAKIKVSVMPLIDVTPFHLANKKGYFKEAGLEVETVNSPSGQAGLTKLIAGDVDISYGGDIPFVMANATGSADIKFVAEASSGKPNTMMILTVPTSPVKNVQDLAGKKIAINGEKGVSDTLTKSVMKANNVDFSKVTWVTLPFPEISGAIARGDVDAGFLVEPFITQASKSVGTVPVVDASSGPTQDFPISAYGATAKFVNENPKTVEAFQRAMARATKEAEADRKIVEPLMVEFAKIDADTASLASLTKFESKLDPARLQRVPDLMLEFGIITQKVDAAGMIAKQPQD